MWSVTELTGYIQELFEIDHHLQKVEVSGELSNFVRARSGHLYFTLKDEGAQLKCAMWKSDARRLRFDPESGDAVVINGRVSVYEAQGVYQLYAKHMTPAGRGNLTLAFEELKEKLAYDGLFDPDSKQPIPRFPRKIGIVTSADAAALQDMLNVLRRRYPLVQVLIAPTLVQGNSAPAQIVQALEWIDGRSDIDTIIIGRGGGSIEDLWAFNDERVARAIFAAQHPVISAVGHETDFTIADFVADLRAPTPSAAAELAVPDIEELAAMLRGGQAKLHNDMTAYLDRRTWQVNELTQKLTHLSPQRRLDTDRQRVDGLLMRLETAVSRRVEREENRIGVMVARLTAVSPLATLERGYAIVKDENGRVLHSVKTITPAASLTIQLKDGEFGATVNFQG